jgi:hypothetical protein
MTRPRPPRAARMVRGVTTDEELPVPTHPPRRRPITRVAGAAVVALAVTSCSSGTTTTPAATPTAAASASTGASAPVLSRAAGRRSSWVTAGLPLFSAVVVAVLGAVMTASAFGGLLG